MCIIVSKEKGIALPKKEVLKNCFENNPDGCGYMYSDGEYVHIRKGFMTFDDFIKDYENTQKKVDLVNNAVVYHFRISTQAGVNKECTHPYPLSSKMKHLKKLFVKTNIGIAHNGIIHLTSSYGKTTHNDTMEFITEYLSLIIENENFYQNKKTLQLIEKLCDSKLAILDKNGHITRIGKFEYDKATGLYFSNGTYQERKYKYVSLTSGGYKSYKDYMNDDWYSGWDNDYAGGYGYNKDYNSSLYTDDNCEGVSKGVLNGKKYYYFEDELEEYIEQDGEQFYYVDGWDEHNDNVGLVLSKDSDGKYIIDEVY